MITYATYSQNAGDDIAGSALKWDIETNGKQFDRMLVVDGRLTPEAKEYYARFPYVEVVDSPWKDSHTLQYQAVKRHLRDGEWCLYLDCDEVPSPKLIEFCKQLPSIAPPDINMVHVPDILYLTEDGQNFYKSLHDPLNHPNDGHIKRILFKAGPTLDFLSSDGFHNVPTHARRDEKGEIVEILEVPMYTYAPYWHLKTVESYIINDCVNAFKSPRNERFTPGETIEFTQALAESNINTMQEFRDTATEGTWSRSLVDFAFRTRNETDRPVSRLYWWYCVIEHPLASDPASEYYDKAHTWDKIKEWVLAPIWLAEFNKSKEAGQYITVPTTPRKLVTV